MPLKVQPLLLSDFDILIDQSTIYAPGDDLIGQPTPICWPVTTTPAAEARALFHFNKQKARFLEDPTATYLKVVDTSTEPNEIVSFARWHYYPSGYSYDAGIEWELHQRPADGGPEWPKEMNVELHNHILNTRDLERAHWEAGMEPCWQLMMLVTRPSHRGRGAARLVLEWGLERARRDGVVACLESSAAAKEVYAKSGFEVVGELEVDVRRFGLAVDRFSMVKMKAVPLKEKEKEKEGSGVGVERELL